jgi:hypothetical protein
MTYLDRGDLRDDGTPLEKTGRIVLSGGESLLAPVREAVTYPVIERLQARYRGKPPRGASSSAAGSNGPELGCPAAALWREVVRPSVPGLAADV